MAFIKPRSHSYLGNYTVIGNPIEHSLSPRIHAIFAKEAGVEIAYSLTLAPVNGFRACVDALVKAGLRGANVTRPFKFEALQMATHATTRAQLAGAANTLRFDQPCGVEDAFICWADNTDGVGLVCDITRNAGVAIEGQRLLLIGAGGAAAGVLGLLIGAKPRQIVVANRTLPKVQKLVANHAELAVQNDVELLATSLNNCGMAFDVIINSTASSQDGYGVPVSAQVLKVGALALDMTYGANALPFMGWAKSHGAHGRDGLGMLIEQAAESFYFWHGIRPDSQAVLQQIMDSLMS